MLGTHIELSGVLKDNISFVTQLGQKEGVPAIFLVFSSDLAPLAVHDLAMRLGVRLPHSTVVARLCFECKAFCMQGFLHAVLNIPKFLNWKLPSC